MIRTIENEFSFLIEEGFQFKIDEVTNIFKKVTYLKPNIKISLECELMENQFDFEIWVCSGNREYSICEWTGRMQLYYQNKGILNVIHKNIFEYTVGFWNEKTFQKRKEEIYKNKHGFGKSRKVFLEFATLYKELILIAKNNIEMTFEGV